MPHAESPLAGPRKTKINGPPVERPPAARAGARSVSFLGPAAPGLTRANTAKQRTIRLLGAGLPTVVLPPEHGCELVTRPQRLRLSSDLRPPHPSSGCNKWDEGGHGRKRKVLPCPRKALRNDLFPPRFGRASAVGSLAPESRAGEERCRCHHAWSPMLRNKSVRGAGESFLFVHGEEITDKVPWMKIDGNSRRASPIPPTASFHHVATINCGPARRGRSGALPVPP